MRFGRDSGLWGSGAKNYVVGPYQLAIDQDPVKFEFSLFWGFLNQSAA